MNTTMNRTVRSLILCALALGGAGLVGACDFNDGVEGEAEEAWDAVQRGAPPEVIGEEVEEITQEVAPTRKDLSDRIDALEKWLLDRRHVDGGDDKVFEELEADLKAAKEALAEGAEGATDQVAESLDNIEHAIDDLDNKH